MIQRALLVACPSAVFADSISSHYSLPTRPVALSVLFSILAIASSAQSLPKESPFAGGASTAPAAAASSAADFELVGMSVVGKTTLLGISRTSDHHSYWIPLGGSVADITAVSFNAKTDQAVIRAGGKPLTLSMRRASVVPASPADPPALPLPHLAAAPATSTASVAPAPPAPMTVQEEKEMEARMLVTDLLEIGQEQRKAYEAAQRAAAEKPATDRAADQPAKK